jgi:hypothetical protein
MRAFRGWRGVSPCSLRNPVSALFAVALSLWGVFARAEINLLQGEQGLLAVGMEAAFGRFLSRDTNFGAGRVDVRSGEATGDAQWSEGYVKPSLRGEYRLRPGGTLYGGVSGVGAFTAGDGDAGGFTRGDDGRVDVESAFAGWRSGKLFSQKLGDDAVDVSYGRQEFHVGDGLLI